MPNWFDLRRRLGHSLNLPLTHSQTEYARTVDSILKPGDHWLDIGCGKRIFPDWAYPPELEKRMIQRAGYACGIDLDPGMLDNTHMHDTLWASIFQLPFRSATFDIATANMVFEHLEHPTEALREVARVLKPGGRLIVHTPNLHYYQVFLASLLPDGFKRRLVWTLEQRREEDVFPTFYQFNKASSIRHCAQASGLHIESLGINVPYGAFSAMGPLGLLEVFVIKLHTLGPMRRFGETFTVILQRQRTPAGNTLQ